MKLVLGKDATEALLTSDMDVVPEVLEPIYNVRVHRAGNHVTFTREEQP